ncbi:phosphotransferase [Geodermatophilus sp. YIM 151500]|uniref:phosphotransferase family protein n=1 Tax=Geodermatophilus sp. YIM 151500 TaxID=2984531 RepID=UPI0021E4926D|nr:phosphotransferase [Geodermatophilus sp. YIM 151500]MCV2492008.1 phosphotransferase [Geodermatophilus sp. YIM 151500]
MSGSAGHSVTGATEALDRYLAEEGGGGARPPLRYLRRKPGRGLVAVFGPGDGGNIYTVKVDEQALLGSPDGTASAAVPAVQRFPVDPQLPHLDTVMSPAAHPDLADALAAAARRVCAVPPDGRLVGIAAEPVRYKPGDRCVIRYRLRFGDPPSAAGNGAVTTCTLVAKLYRETHEAQAATDLLARLHDEAAVAWTARPLGVVPGLPLALTEDLGSSRDRVPARSGLRVVHPGSEVAPEVIARAARALAELHTSGLQPADPTPRTGADEAGKAAKRAKLLAQHVPELAPVVRRVTDPLCATLTGLPGDTLRPAHGSYKSSQLLVRDGAVFLVDFDQFCLADPALDVGYFLAYLRPAGLWYRRTGRRAWFEAAAQTFRSAYADRLSERGESAETCAGIVQRAPVFEAALLLKIAARRVNRLHSPRPGEVAAVLAEVSRALALVEGPLALDEGRSRLVSG